MTIRDQLAAKIRSLMCDMLDLSEDPDISPAFKRDLMLAISEVGGAEAVITTDDSGPTRADIEGEISHV